MPSLAASPRRARRFTPTAFTLLELLVVIAMVAILAAMLAMAARVVWRRYAEVRCQTNLRRIYEAVAMRQDDQATGDAGAWRVSSWPAALLPYVESQSTVFFCPEGGGAASIAGPEPVLRFFYPGKPWYTELKEGPYVLKLSQTQLNDLKGLGYIVERKTVPPNLRWPYAPDSNPDLFWYCSEDWHQPQTDYDFEDILVKVVNDGRGTVTMEFFKGVGYAARLEDADGNVLVDPVKTGSTYSYQVDLYGEANYGVNEWAAEKRIVGTARILAMDYHVLVVRTSDDWTGEEADSDGDGMPDFARHTGRVNVLLGDGSVTPMDPGEIDPADPAAAERFWLPQGF
jgi:prepilin-type N-terminal cleavage/methylation domain-containing protein/prepilin-type processing-associated H-X9-DG protein